MAVSDAKKRANNKWVDKNYKRFSVAFPKDEADEIIDYCEKNNITKNAFFRQAAIEKIERDK